MLLQLNYKVQQVLIGSDGFTVTAGSSDAEWRKWK